MHFGVVHLKRPPPPGTISLRDGEVAACLIKQSGFVLGLKVGPAEDWRKTHTAKVFALTQSLNGEAGRDFGPQPGAAIRCPA